MEDIEVPTEHLQEHIKEQAEHAAPHASHARQDRLSMRVALSSAIIVVLASLSGLQGGHHANEAVIEQMEVADQWSFYQAKGIKIAVLHGTNDTLAALGKPPPAESLAKLEQYRKEQAEIEGKAHEKEHSAAAHLHHYKILANAATLFQMGIALAAIAVLTRRRPLWYGSLGLGIAGLVFLILGLL